MTNEKFKSEINLLKKFFELYCKNKHQNQKPFEINKTYKNENIKTTLFLCGDCKKLIDYSIQRLQECPHEEKPRCRKCPNPCYEKSYWKNLSKIMRFGALKLCLSKVKKFIT